MANRIPLVIIGTGNIGELPTGDLLNGPSMGVSLTQFVNNSGVTLNKGEVCYINGNNTVAKAKADAIGTTAQCVGLIYETTVANGATGSLQSSGIQTGILTGATANTIYFLSSTTAGALSTTVPTASASVVLALGAASNTTDFYIKIGVPLIRQ